MQFLVVGTDGPEFDFGPSAQHEAHQTYMDGWLDLMVARGPRLSADGEQHTGSVHVVDVADADVAHRFAFEEPYARHGWYSEVTVTPVLPCADGTMWDRPAPAPDGIGTFVRAELTIPGLTALGLADAVRRDLERSAEPPWVYVAVTLGDDGHARGLVGIVDLTPAEARERIEALSLVATDAPPTHVGCDRWQRGGRAVDAPTDEEA